MAKKKLETGQEIQMTLDNWNKTVKNVKRMKNHKIITNNTVTTIIGANKQGAVSLSMDTSKGVHETKTIHEINQKDHGFTRVVGGHGMLERTVYPVKINIGTAAKNVVHLAEPSKKNKSKYAKVKSDTQDKINEIYWGDDGEEPDWNRIAEKQSEIEELGRKGGHIKELKENGIL